MNKHVIKVLTTCALAAMLIYASKETGENWVGLNKEYEASLVKVDNAVVTELQDNEKAQNAVLNRISYAIEGAETPEDIQAKINEITTKEELKRVAKSHDHDKDIQTAEDESFDAWAEADWAGTVAGCVGMSAVLATGLFGASLAEAGSSAVKAIKKRGKKNKAQRTEPKPRTSNGPDSRFEIGEDGVDFGVINEQFGNDNENEMM